MEKRIWTIGHSNKSFQEFLDMLQSASIEAIADVRRYPSSRKFPYYNETELSNKLLEAGIEYYSFKELGGRRTPLASSKNTAWRNESFRGYADYMETEEFLKGIHRLVSEASHLRVAIMCSEALWWQCHRSLISDYLKVTGFEVIHILTSKKTELHPYTQPARIIDGKLDYSHPQSELRFTSDE